MSGGKIKVGVTKEKNKYMRWIDQGAEYITIFAKMPNRYLAGVLESHLKGFISDKTNWRNMLKNIPTKDYNQLINITKEKLLLEIPKEIKKYMLKKEKITQIKYPHSKKLEKINSITFDKVEKIKGILTGVKGQYFIFNDNNVFNVRRHEGLKVKLTL